MITRKPEVTKEAWSFKDYYERNRKRLLKLKRERYAKDPAYRRAVKRRSQKRYRLLRKLNPPEERGVVRGERGEKYVTIGKLSKVVGRSITAIRSYHIRGVIPSPKYFTEQGWRLYSEKEVKVFGSAFAALDQGRLRNLKEVAKYIRRKL